MNETKLFRRVDKDIWKNILWGEAGFYENQSGRYGKQPLRVRTPQLRRSINSGFSRPPNSVFLRYLKFYYPREKLFRQKMFLVKFPTWQLVSEKRNPVKR